MTVSGTTPRRVLVADDNEDILKVLSRLLTSWGYEPVPARDGFEAWEIIQSDACPGVALLDWNMPRIDGLEVCHRTRGLLRLPLPYLIMLTGRSTRDDLVAGLDGGADEYLAKPIEPDELRARLGAAWRLADLQAGLAARVRQLEETPPVLEVVSKDHPGLRQTLRLCVASLAETLNLPGLPPHIRVTLRTCRALCLEGLGEGNGRAGSGAVAEGKGQTH